MKLIILTLLFPAFSWALLESEVAAMKNEKMSFTIAACQENSFLRGCYHISETSCKTQVKKSFDSCWKFLEKKVNFSKLSLTEMQTKIDSCTLREVGLQQKTKPKSSPVCVLPKKETL